MSHSHITNKLFNLFCFSSVEIIQMLLMCEMKLSDLNLGVQDLERQAWKSCFRISLPCCKWKRKAFPNYCLSFLATYLEEYWILRSCSWSSFFIFCCLVRRQLYINLWYQQVVWTEIKTQNLLQQTEIAVKVSMF